MRPDWRTVRPSSWPRRRDDHLRRTGGPRNRLAHLFRARGLKRLDHYAIFMENHPRYVECCGGGERSGLYFTCVNSFLTPEELAYIVNNCEARILITLAGQARRGAGGAEGLPQGRTRCRRRTGRRRQDRQPGGSDEGLFRRRRSPMNFWHADALFVRHDRPPERASCARCPSSRRRSACPVRLSRPALALSRGHDLPRRPALPFSPQAAVNLAIAKGAKVVIMERFEPEHYLELVQNIASPTRSSCRPCSRAC